MLVKIIEARKKETVCNIKEIKKAVEYSTAFFSIKKFDYYFNVF